MSYQVLARKWRPKNFSEVVGQSHVLTALENGLKENRLHHAYLFVVYHRLPEADRATIAQLIQHPVPGKKSPPEIG